MSNLAVFDFQGQEVRFVDGWPVANDVITVLGFTEKRFSDDECYSPFDLLAIAVELGCEGKTKESENILSFIRRSGMITDGTIERIYHACRIHQAWVMNLPECDNESGPCVYLIGVRKNKTLKIGYSTQIKKRIESLKVSSPFPLELISKVDGSMSLERKLHKEFNHLRISGEWFEWSDEIINKFKQLETKN